MESLAWIGVIILGFLDIVYFHILDDQTPHDPDTHYHRPRPPHDNTSIFPPDQWLN